MRIVELYAENIKNLKAVTIRPNRDVVHITGGNGSGKTSTLDAIAWALAGAAGITSKPIRKGEQRATIRLNLGEFTVIRRFTEGGATSLVVESKDGAQYKSPQRMLDAILGELSFDPLAFSRMAPKQQLETLRALVPLDIDINALDQQNERDYVLRTDWNRRVASLREREATLRDGVVADMDVDLIDESTLLSQMERAADHNAAIDRAVGDRLSLAQEIMTLGDNAAAKRGTAARLLEEAEHLEARQAEKQRLLSEASVLDGRVDVSELRRQIEEARKTNAQREAQARQRVQHQIAVDSLQAALANTQHLTNEMARRTTEKHEAIGRAQMPVEGLSFGDGEVLLNGLPLDQASSAEQLRVSVALAMAANPKLRVLRIQDGSLLDEKSMKLLEEMAALKDYQLWCEVVSSDAKIGIHMIDGSVAAVDGVPVEPAQEALVGDPS